MRNQELECLPQWRYCKIPYGAKRPREPDWEKKPYTLDQIPDNMNIGVILGEASNGLLAIDFDGPWAWEYWQEHIQIDFDTIDTIMWTSNKPGRCQMAFSVPKEAWELMPNFKVKGPIGDDGKPQMLEVRWGNSISGLQSVLPPSLHPDNTQDPNINYCWLCEPSRTDLQEIPIALLEWIVNYQAPVPAYTDVDLPPIDINDIKEDQFNHLVALLEQLKGFNSRPDHDTWRNWAYAAASEVGPAAAAEVLKVVFPEEKPGEYRQLLKNWKSSKSPGIQLLERLVKNYLGANKRIIKNNNTY